MGLLAECEVIFGTSELYEVLSVNKNASEIEIKKSYHKLSLKIHPDRVDEKGKFDATKKFQVLSKVYFILSNKEKKAVYDETGGVDNDTFSDDRNWNEYWRLLFPKITVAAIENFLKKYKGSDEEVEDLKTNYLRFEGDLDLMQEYMIGYEIQEEDRYKGILQSLIASKDVQAFPKFTKETLAKSTKRKKKLKSEAKEAENMRKELGLDNDGDGALKNAIAKRQAVRQNNFDSLISSLEEKYSKPKGKKNSKPKQ